MVSCTITARAVASRWDWGWFGDPGFWSATWKVTKCVASVTLAIVPLAKAGSIVKSLGGIRKTAELLVKAGNWSDVRKAAPALAGEILGISAIAPTASEGLGMARTPGRDELDRAWARTSPLLPAAISSFLLTYVVASLGLTRSLALTDGTFIVVFAAVMLAVAVLERRDLFKPTSARLALIACAALLGAIPAVLSALAR